MANIFIEQRQQEYVAIEAGEVIARGNTQEQCIEEAHRKRPGVKLDVERVRERDDAGPDRWRSE